MAGEEGSGLAAMMGVYGLLWNASLPSLPQPVVEMLGRHIAMMPETLECLDTGSLSYTLVGRHPVIQSPITGVVVSGNVSQLVVQLSLLTAQPGYMKRATLVVVHPKPSQTLFRELWYKRWPTVVYYTPGLVAYNPFTDQLFEIQDPADLAGIMSGRWRDMNGHSLIVDVHKHPLGFLNPNQARLGEGLDSSALHELSRHWNMTPSIFRPDNSWFDYTIDLSDKHVLAEKVDLSFNARFMITSNTDLYFEYSTTIFADSIVIVMRRARKVRGWDVFLSIFRWDVWAALFITIILINRFLLLTSRKKEWNNSLILTLRSMFAIPVRKVPSQVSHRFVLGSALCVSIVIVNTYLARLYHIIKNERTYKDPQSLEEVNDLGLPLKTASPGLKDYFQMSSSVKVKEMGSRVEHEHLSDDLLQHNAFVIREKELKLHMAANYIRRDLHIVPEKVLSFTMAYIVKRGSAFLEPLSEFTARAFEGGLHHWWYMTTAVTLHDHYIEQNVSHNLHSPEHVGLTISDIEVAFFTLFLGQGISGTVFLMELLIHYLVRSKFKLTRLFCKKLQNLCP